MIPHSLTPRLMELQPVIVLGDEIYVRARGRDSQARSPASLVTSQNVSHPLKRIGSIGSLGEHHTRTNGAQLRSLYRSQLGAAWANDAESVLAYFLGHLVPRFLQRDWDEEYEQLPDLGASATVDLESEIDSVPPAVVPRPSLWTLGRGWLLSPNSYTPQHVSVHQNGMRLGPTGEVAPIQDLEKLWMLELEKAAREKMSQLARSFRPDLDGFREAKDQLNRDGFLEYGDLLLIAGDPPRLGIVVPPHFNRTFDRNSERNMAITAPLQLPPRAAGLEVFGRSTEEARWQPLRLPHGLCLGRGPAGPVPPDPGIALAARLRWAAIRIATNQKFHEGDP